MTKQILNLCCFIAGMIGLTSCPRPFLPTFCDVPRQITVVNTCYDSTKGITLQAGSMTNPDTSIRLSWTVYIMADTATTSIASHPQLNNVAGDYVFNVSNSLLDNKAKIYVELNSTCAGINKDKVRGGYSIAFVKRYNKTSNCYQWGVQPF